jgi:hypothetical protein
MDSNLLTLYFLKYQMKADTYLKYEKIFILFFFIHFT